MPYEVAYVACGDSGSDLNDLAYTGGREDNLGVGGAVPDSYGGDCLAGCVENGSAVGAFVGGKHVADLNAVGAF
jgi:hypothetical protein